MIVIADTAPMNYLVLIGEQELLPALFGQVIIPEVKKSNGRDALPRVRRPETQAGRGAPRPYRIRFIRQTEFFHSSPARGDRSVYTRVYLVEQFFLERDRQRKSREPGSQE